MKAIDKKFEQNKAQYHLDRQTAKISDLSTGYDGKYKSLTGKEEKCFTGKRFTRKCCWFEKT